MELLISKLVSSVIQILLFSIVPLVWWLITARKKENFFHWIGLKKIIGSKDFIKIFLLIIFAFLSLSITMLFMMRGVEMATSEFYGLGISALPATIVYAFLNTALSEEILFRGFLLKRISSRLGFMVGNAIQAVLFGLLHGIMFFNTIGVFKVIVVIVFTGLIGWCMGYINEQKAQGSILPSWIIHGVANLFTSIMAMFAVL